jgi:predicted nucleotidyltransferase
MDRKKIDRIIRIYLKDLSKKIKVDKAILFGSALTGKFNRDSDIDLLILSSAFSKMDISDRFDLLYAARQSGETQRAAMDIFGLTPREYSQADSLTVVGEIKETGRELRYFP